jgi:uncharacterized membrane protein YeaQ/YmgE (transglycosylase-associated protein family)
LSVVIWLVIGLLTAFVSRFVVPGAEPIGLWDTLVLGLVGSLTGGLLGSLVFAGDVAPAVSGAAGALLGATVVLLYSRSTGNRVVTL